MPTGNFGDVFAGWIAKKMGLPIDRLVIATNVELNIGHFLIGEAIFVGLGNAVAKMRSAMAEGRAAAAGGR